MMFWKVTSEFYDTGACTARIDEVQADKRPENDFKETAMCDIYHDYFDSYEEAYDFKVQTENA